VNYQIYNFQPLNFTLLTDPTEGTPVANFKPELMKSYWDEGFKVNFLKYLNNNYNPSFVIPSQTFAFIDPLLQKSVSNVKFDLYDKFAIVNIQPNFKSQELILLLKKYI
jgi:hypothetical protein